MINNIFKGIGTLKEKNIMLTFNKQGWENRKIIQSMEIIE